MASSGTITFIFTVIFITAGNAENSFVNVKCSAENVGQYGHESLLNCVVETTREAADAQIRVVAWKKDREALLIYHQGEWTQKPGYRFADDSWMDTKNISLLITGTVMANEGTYSCLVITDRGDKKIQTSLQVKAKYSRPQIDYSPEKITQNADSTLTCESEGGYPKGQIRWFDENQHDWTKSSEMEAIQTDSGLYQLKSKLLLLSGSTFSKYTCVVFNASGGKEEETTYEITSTPSGLDGQPGVNEASKIVAPILVIGSLLVGLLVVLLFKKRSRQARRPSAAPLMGSDVHGHECPHEKCRQEAEEMMKKDSPA